jgi:hypothetical protein
MGVFSDWASMQRILFSVFYYENKQQGINTPLLMTQTLLYYHKWHYIDYYLVVMAV